MPSKTSGRALTRRWVSAAVALTVLTAAPAAQAAKAPNPPPGQEDPTQVLLDRPDEPVELIPDGTKRKKDAVTGEYATIARYVINPANSAPWASLRNWHQQFFIGSVADGHTLEAVRSYSYSRLGFVPARGFCGYVLAENLDPISGTGDSPCSSSWQLNPEQHSQFINCDNCNGGWKVTLQHGTTLYRNAYPWVASNPPVQDASIYRDAGYPVYWRYVTEDGNWVAVSDAGVSHLNWFFVPRSAIPGICGGGANARPSSRAGWGLSCSQAP